jgi:hypothetical protein
MPVSSGAARVHLVAVAEAVVRFVRVKVSQLDRASTQAGAVAVSWPQHVSLLARRLSEGWTSHQAHIWTAGRMSTDPAALAQRPFAAVAFDTRTGALSVERTWPTLLGEDDEALNYYAAREPNVIAELLVSLRLAGELLASYGRPVDVAFYVGAATPDGFLVSSERGAGPGLAEPIALGATPPAEVPATHLDYDLFDLEHLADPQVAATALAGPWLETFNRGGLIAELIAP